MWQEGSESARERRIALYEIDQREYVQRDMFCHHAWTCSNNVCSICLQTLELTVLFGHGKCVIPSVHTTVPRSLSQYRKALKKRNSGRSFPSNICYKDWHGVFQRHCIVWLKEFLSDGSNWFSALAKFRPRILTWIEMQCSCTHCYSWAVQRDVVLKQTTTGFGFRWRANK